MSIVPLHRVSQSTVLLATLAGCFGAACQSQSASAPPVSENTWATIDGRQISKDEVEKAYRRTRDVEQAISDEEATTAKLALLNDLIVQDLLLAKATQLKVELSESDLDTAFNNAKNNIDDAAFQQELTRRGLTPADMREGLRREMLTQKVITQEVSSKVLVSDKEIADFFDANRAQFNIPEESYHLAQIVVTPVRDAQVTNGTGDDATTPEAALQKAQMLMDRLKAGAPFQQLALGYSEDPESAPRGGDLGLVPISRLRQAPLPLRNAVIGKAPGSVNVASVNGAHTLVLVVAHEQAGQRDLSTPAVKEQITQTLHARREQLLRAAYLTALQTDANVTNYLARQIVASTPASTPSPTLQPPAPGGTK